MNIVVFLTKKFDKNDIPFGNLLCKNMVYTSKKYNTKNKMAIIGEELYGASVSASFGISGKTESYVFSLDFLNPKYTDNDYLEKSIDFLYKERLFVLCMDIYTLYKPDVGCYNVNHNNNLSVLQIETWREKQCLKN